jgi:hypothetical protein
MKVKDMLLAEALEEQRRRDEEALTAFKEQNEEI